MKLLLDPHGLWRPIWVRIPLRVKASVVLLAGLVASGFAVGIHPKDASVVGEIITAVACHALLLLPGVLIALRCFERDAAQPQHFLDSVRSEILVCAVVFHAFTLCGPVTHSEGGWNRDWDLEFGYDAYHAALIFPLGVQTAWVPWWLANLVIALLPFLSTADSLSKRTIVAVAGIALGVLAWAPAFDRSNDIWQDHISGLYWGYFLWATLISVLGGVCTLFFLADERTS